MTDANGTPQLLVVEDEAILLDILVETLTENGYAVQVAETGAAAARLLEAHAGTFDAILLDRLLPDMDSLGLIPQIKRNPALAHVPVIIQTSLTSPEDVAAGLNAGAYYYLTKPFPPETLLSIVRAAVRDRLAYLDLQGRIRHAEGIMRHLVRGEFNFRTQSEARDLAALVAHAAPDPTRVVLGLTELMLNAVEHGNLAITYEEKSSLIAADALVDEVEKRLADGPYSGRTARLFLARSNDQVEFVVQDEGSGFNWEPFLEMAPDRAFDTHGRGIAMSRLLSFDYIEYRGRGNEVVCRVQLH
ncbi:MAG: response regulator [Rhodocyclaceae bacterium]|nr:response regulator [Rhodocyclaceae bacterium]MDZ4213307.1 response regulator [Rhodocyclaceae bacterium]